MSVYVIPEEELELNGGRSLKGKSPSPSTEEGGIKSFSTNVDGFDGDEDIFIDGQKEGKVQVKEIERMNGSKDKRRYRGVISYFREYCGNTSLHGLKYMGEEKRPFIERLCWIIAFILSIIACSHLIFKIWKKWDNTPVIVSFADSSTPVWQIPFPAVTICSEIKYRKSVFNYTHVNQMISSEQDISDELRKQHEYRGLICDDDFIFLNGSMEADIGVIQFFQEAAPPCSDLIYCYWKGKEFGDCCGELFRPILTEEGVCYTFNMLQMNQFFSNNQSVEGFDEKYDIEEHSDIPWTEWNVQDGYPTSASLETYPKRGPGAGASSRLEIFLKGDPNEIDVRCRIVGGFKVLLHNPSEFPRVNQQFFRVPLDQDVVASVKPSIMGTSYELQDYPSSRRRCLFQRERQLRFFTFYTHSNCELECLVNATLEICNCMMFFMPRSDYPICGSGSLACIRNTTENLRNIEILAAMNSLDNTESKIGGCNCLPACTELNYDAETSIGMLNLDMILSEFNITEEAFGGQRLAKLSIFFKEWQFITSRRGELYGQTDFLANCGGILGLCMGFSVLSLVEIVYFLTLRLYHNLKEKIKGNKNIPETWEDKDK